MVVVVVVVKAGFTGIFVGFWGIPVGLGFGLGFGLGLGLVGALVGFGFGFGFCHSTPAEKIVYLQFIYCYLAENKSL